MLVTSPCHSSAKVSFNVQRLPFFQSNGLVYLGKPVRSVSDTNTRSSNALTMSKANEEEEEEEEEE
jgi:hypothetical protein